MYIYRYIFARVRARERARVFIAVVFFFSAVLFFGPFWCQRGGAFCHRSLVLVVALVLAKHWWGIVKERKTEREREKGGRKEEWKETKVRRRKNGWGERG